jgi:hypothetical protein
MHKMKEEVILRILAQESQKSELLLRRYDEKKLQGLSCNFWKVARAKLEFIFKNQGSSWNFCRLHLDFTEGQGANCKISGDFLARIFFQWENTVDLVHHPWTMGGTGPRWTMDRASAVAHQSST